MEAFQYAQERRRRAPPISSPGRAVGQDRLNPLLRLQRDIGNRGVQHIMRTLDDEPASEGLPERGGRSKPGDSTPVCDKQKCKDSAVSNTTLAISSSDSYVLDTYLRALGVLNIENLDSGVVHTIDLSPWGLVRPYRLGVHPGRIRQVRVVYRPKSVVKLTGDIPTIHKPTRNRPNRIEMCVCP